MKTTINGRPGVVVAGGEHNFKPNLRSLEFFDLSEGKWNNLGTMRQGRKFPGLTAIDQQLVVAGRRCV